MAKIPLDEETLAPGAELYAAGALSVLTGNV